MLNSGTLATFAGEVDKQNGGPSFRQVAGVTYLGAGSILDLNEATDAFLMSGGALSIQLNEGSGQIEIRGNVKITGGDIISGANSNGDTHLFGTLFVHGNVNWTGGTYRPFVSADTDYVSDVWISTGTFTIGGTAAIVPTAVDGENNAVTPTDPLIWNLFISDGGITNANGTPSLGNNWGWDKDPNAKWWKLKSF